MVNFDDVINHFKDLAAELDPKKPMVGFITGFGTYHMIRTVMGACVRMWGWDSDIKEVEIRELAIKYGTRVDPLPDEDMIISIRLEEPDTERLIKELLKSDQIRKIYDDYIIKEITFENWVRETTKRLLVAPREIDIKEVLSKVLED